MSNLEASLSGSKWCLYCDGAVPRHSRVQFCSDTCRFWHKVDKRGPKECWLWLGTKPAFGHGQFVCQGSVVYAHRFAWEQYYGQIPEGDNGCILHKCDVPACVNPTHLFMGTREENLADMRRKGRGSKPPIHRGAANSQTKLNDDIVREIKAAMGTPKEIATRFGIPRRIYYRIRAGETWGHVR